MNINNATATNLIESKNNKSEPDEIIKSLEYSNKFNFTTSIREFIKLHGEIFLAEQELNMNKIKLIKKYIMINYGNNIDDLIDTIIILGTTSKNVNNIDYSEQAKSKHIVVFSNNVISFHGQLINKLIDNGTITKSFTDKFALINNYSYDTTKNYATAFDNIMVGLSAYPANFIKSSFQGYLSDNAMKCVRNDMAEIFSEIMTFNLKKEGFKYDPFILKKMYFLKDNMAEIHENLAKIINHQLDTLNKFNYAEYVQNQSKRTYPTYLNNCFVIENRNIDAYINIDKNNQEEKKEIISKTIQIAMRCQDKYGYNINLACKDNNIIKFPKDKSWCVCDLIYNNMDREMDIILKIEAYTYTITSKDLERHCIAGNMGIINIDTDSSHISQQLPIEEYNEFIDLC